MVHTGGSSATPSRFDFNSQAGVLAVLTAVRNSQLPKAQQRELRDLIFAYATSGGDTALRTNIENRLAAAGVTPEAATQSGETKAEPARTSSGTGEKPSPAPSTPASVSGFAGPRAVPTFTVPAVPQSSPATATSSDSIPKSTSQQVMQPVADPAVTPPTAQVTVITPTVPPAEVSAQPTVVPAVAVPVVPRPNQFPTEEVSNGTLTNSTPASSPTTPTTPSVAPTPEPVTAAAIALDADAGTAVERIKVIKADINAKVGNPVNLVDIDNAIGREYMAALLEAMKQVAGGGGSVPFAMQRLETVYAQVLTILNKPQDSMSAAPIAPESTSVTVAPAPLTSTGPGATTDPVLPVQSPVVPVVPSTPATPSPSPVQPTPVTPVTPVVSPAEPGSAHAAPPPPVPTSGYDAAPLVADSDEQSVPIHSTRFGIASVASAPPLRTVSELPTAESLATASVSGNPLYTKEVDMGLDQLLSEWTLFRKSGLFGTGPKGRNHPLFEKLAPLQIPLILAGRFEGATPEIKQSVTDYMNGWRYEQGIVYEDGETFEQYLRRVIRHILDWQDGKPNT